MKKEVTMYINVLQAKHLASLLGISVSSPTIISWVRKFGLGRQIAGKKSKWLIDEKKIKAFLSGDKYDKT